MSPGCHFAPRTLCFAPTGHKTRVRLTNPGRRGSPHPKIRSAPKQRAPGMAQPAAGTFPAPAPAPLSGKREQPRRFTRRILFLWKVNPAPASAEAAAGPAPRGCCGSCPGRAPGRVPAGATAASLGNPISLCNRTGKAVDLGTGARWHPSAWGHPFPRHPQPRGCSPYTRTGTAHAKGPEQPLEPPEPRAQHRDARARLLLAHPPAHEDPRSRRTGTFLAPP